MTTIAIVSTTGGAGRTTLTATLAAVFARRNRPVVAIDFDPQNLLGVHLGMDSVPAQGIGNISGNAPWHAHAYRNNDGVVFVPYGHLSLREHVEREAHLAAQPQWLARSIAQIDLPKDGIVLIDTPRYPSQQAWQALRCADLALCLVTPEPGACATFREHAQELRSACRQYRVLVNRLNPARDVQRGVLALFHAAMMQIGPAPRERNDLLLKQRMHFDAAMPEALARGLCLLDDAPNSQVTHDVYGVAGWIETWMTAT